VTQESIFNWSPLVKFHDLFTQAPSGLFVLDIYRRGVLIEHFEEENLIVDGSKLTHARLLGGDVAGRSVTQFGVGTNGTAPAGGNTTLASPFIKTVDGTTYPATNQVQFAFSLGVGEANGKAIMEFGLFTAGGALYARKVRATALNKESDISFTGSWTISF
jgi:hypothetical protein